jgi:septal ring factor EnvC (AmiA/AmiB activator)
MSDRIRPSYVALVAALRAEFNAAGLEAMRIQLQPHRYNPTSLGVLVQAVRDAVDVTFAADPTDDTSELLDELSTARDRTYELENLIGVEQQEHEHIRSRLREMERERDDLDYQLREIERERDELRRQASDLESQLYSARHEANALRGGWR